MSETEPVNLTAERVLEMINVSIHDEEPVPPVFIPVEGTYHIAVYFFHAEVDDEQTIFYGYVQRTDKTAPAIANFIDTLDQETEIPVIRVPAAMLDSRITDSLQVTSISRQEVEQYGYFPKPLTRTPDES